MAQGNPGQRERSSSWPTSCLSPGYRATLGASSSRPCPPTPRSTRIIGVDVVPPGHSLGRAEFVRADIRNPMIGRIINQGAVDTVVHMNVLSTPTQVGGRTSQKEINVIGTMQLLAACQKAPSMRRLVVKSSSAVYGSSPRDPGLFTEDTGPKAMPRSGFGKDSIEVEGYVRGFSRRRPDIEITMLRFANVIGPGIRTGFTDYFSLPIVPVPFGFDARLQFVHEDDATRAMTMAVTNPTAASIVNVAGDGMITVTQCAAMTGRATLPVLFGKGLLATVLRKTGLGRLLARPAVPAELRARLGHHENARGAAFRAGHDHPSGVPGLRRPRPSGAAGSRPGPRRAGPNRRRHGAGA